MSFSEQTEKLVNDLIQAEYKNACEKFGEKYNSLHEGYAVLLEEVEEVKSEFDKLVINTEWIWKENERLQQQIEKMKCCRNCKYWNVPDDVFNTPCEKCDVCKDFNKWELAE